MVKLSFYWPCWICLKLGRTSIIAMFTKLPLHYHHIPTDCLKIFVCINTHTKRDREIEREREREQEREREKEREWEKEREKRERCHYLSLLRGSQKIKKFLSIPQMVDFPYFPLGKLNNNLKQTQDKIISKYKYGWVQPWPVAVPASRPSSFRSSSARCPSPATATNSTSSNRRAPAIRDDHGGKTWGFHWIYTECMRVFEFSEI